MYETLCKCLAIAVLTGALMTAMGCGSRPRSDWRGDCPPYHVYADSQKATISGNGLSLKASSSAIRQSMENGGPFTVTDGSGASFTVQLSAGAIAAMKAGDPCAAVAEIVALATTVTKSNGGGATPAPPTVPTPVDGGGAPNPGPTQAAEDPHDSSLSGDYVLYPGAYGALKFKNANVSLARANGSDPTKPATYEIQKLTMENCTMSTDPGQTVIYMTGDFSCTSTTITVPGSGSPASPDARNLLILGTAGYHSVTFDHCPQFSAGIYAPSAPVNITATNIFGSAVGSSVFTKNSVITYDPHLKVLNMSGLGMAAARSIDESRK